MSSSPPVREQKQVISFHAKLAQLAQEYESLYLENLNLRNMIAGDARVSPAGVSESDSSVPANLLSERVPEVSVPELLSEQSVSCNLAPAPADPWQEAEVLAERRPSSIASSDIQTLELLSPREHAHSQKPLVACKDMDPIILDIKEDCMSDSICSSDAEQKKSIPECPTPTVSGSGTFAAGLFPLWFDPGDIEEDEMSEFSPFSRGVSPTSYLPDVLGKADRCLLLPLGYARLIWDLIAFLCILLELWMTPFQLIFCDNFQTPRGIEVMSYVINAFFACDVVLNFNTGYIDGDTMIMQRRLIISNYVRSWFFVDLLATVPWDLILMSLGGVMTMGKMGKASRTLKAVRYLKMARLVKLMRTMQQANFMSAHSHKFSMIAKFFKKPTLLFMFLILFSHFHGIVYAALQPSEWLATNSIRESLDRYVESFWWAFTAISCGVPPGAQHSGSASSSIVWLLDMILMLERFLVMLYVGEQVIIRSLCYIDEARDAYHRKEMMKHLRENSVSMMTQLQVLFTWKETGKTQTKRKQFSELMNDNLPGELKRSICDELWSAKLMSMGLIKHVAQWHSRFVKDLAQLASEESFASTSTVFHLGEASNVAYHIVSGMLAITNSCSQRHVPDFTKGMWVGESALVSTVLRRSATCVAKRSTSCMALHGDHFQQLLSDLGLTSKFQDFCAEHLWRGICGRCGMLGDHFSDTCGDRRKYSFLFKPLGSQSSDLQQFLDEKKFAWLLPSLLQMGICSLHDLELADKQILRSKLSKQKPGHMTDEFLSSVLTEIGDFRQIKSRQAYQALFHEVSRLHHLIFLSHYKVEAGTEAALMRNELESAIKHDSGHIGNNFNSPVFLDSDNLVSLEDLQCRVQNTHNLVLLLTKGVLKRPWVLVEIMTARREGVRILLVNVSKPGVGFEFPDDSFFMDLAAGRYLDHDAVELIRRCGFSLNDVEEALRAVFQQIAVPYSPHKASSLRNAEIAAVLKQCRLKTEALTSARTTRSSSWCSQSTKGSSLASPMPLCKHHHTV